MPLRCVPGLRLALVVLLIASPRAGGHETDQYTLPPTRELADLGPHLTAWAYNAIEKGVKQANEQIAAAAETGRPDLVTKRLSDAEVANTVNRQFPIALFIIEDLNHKVKDPKFRQHYPGVLAGYQTNDTIRTKIELPLNPFNAWNCATIKAFDVYLGTDKIGHFTHMGSFYYKAYRQALDQGKSEDEAVQAAIRIGTDGAILSEKGILGYVTAGAYSNADLVANYMGMQFYRNLTQPVMLKGQMRPPMLERDGQQWRIADHVRPDSDFLSWFFSEHYNEVLNPSHYLPINQGRIKSGILDRREIVLERYRDPNGNRRPASYFAQRAEELSTYWGFDYGHEGETDELLSLDRVCFTAFHPSQELDERDRSGRNAMHLAAASGDLSCLRRYIERGGDVNEPVRSKEKRSSEWGMTPLHLAAQDNQLEAARMLLDAGAEVNAECDRGTTPLHLAVHHPEMIELLIARGADVNAADARGRTPLHWAAYDPEATTLELLIAHGGNVNAADNDGETPLHRAVRAGNAPATRQLLDADADASATDKFDITPLHLAAGTRAREVAVLLARAGADVDATDQFGATPLHDATRAKDPTMVALLLQHGAEPTAADAYGATPLHIAGRAGLTSIAQLLLDAGADAFAHAPGRGTPIDEARRAGRDELANLLATGREDGAVLSASIQEPAPPPDAE